MTSARKLVREQSIGSLATLDAASGHPYASLVTVATAIDASPVFLISKLALHTRNLEADSRASLLLAETVGSGDPLDLGRVSLMGVAEPVKDDLIRRRFLAKHPGASVYVDFADFSFWRLNIERAHYIGGFGRIVTLDGADLLVPPEIAAPWQAGVEAVIGRVNEENAERVGRLAGSQDAECAMLACDPDGCDLSRGDTPVRIAFRRRLSAPDQITEALQELDRNEADRAG